MSDFTSMVSTLIARSRTKKAIRIIEKNNELRKNITRYEPSEIEGFIERDKTVGSYVISGENPLNRARAAASVAACSMAQGLPVIILHEGNKLLESHVRTSTSFTGNKVIITGSASVYDPFYNRTEQEICNLIVNSAGEHTLINALGQQYLLGVIDFIRSKNIPPYCEMLMSCPHEQLFEKIDEAESNGYLPQAKAASIRSQLMTSQSERAAIQAFFSQLAYQGAGILSTRGSRSSAVNIRTAVSHSGMIMIDIGSSTNEILLNLIVNEIKEVLTSGQKVMLILDGININSNKLLGTVVKSLSSRCLTALAAEDVYSMLGADDNMFGSFVGNACKCIVFSHSSGITCSKWSEVFGYCDVDKVSQNMGGMQTYQWGYGFGSQYSINVSTQREFIVKPEEIARMAADEVYVLDRNARELANATLV